MTSQAPAPRRTISLAHANFPDLPPPAMVELAAEAGYDAVGLRLEPVGEDQRYPMLGSSPMLRETKARLRDTGLQVLDIEVFRLESGKDFARYERVLEACAEVAADSLLLTCSIADANERVDSFAQACRVSEPYGLNVALEFKPWDPVCTIAIAAGMVAAVNLDNAKMLVDTLHVHRAGLGTDALEAVPASFTTYMQICDAAGPRSTVEDIIREARHARLFPGEGDIPIADIIARLPSSSSISVEIQNDENRRNLGDLAMAMRGLQTTRAFLE